MRLVKLITIVTVGASVILWIRAGETFHIAKTFPLLGGYAPDVLYDGAGLLMLLMVIFGLRNPFRRDDDDA